MEKYYFALVMYQDGDKSKFDNIFLNFHPFVYIQDEKKEGRKSIIFFYKEIDIKEYALGKTNITDVLK